MGAQLIDTIVNFMFGCRHRHLSRPMAEPSKPGARPSAAFVVCLDCGQRYSYDLDRMRMGKQVNTSAPRESTM